VAGASKGLGYAIALELAREGARVAICGRDPVEVGKAAASISEATGSRVEGIPADVATAEGAEGFIGRAVESLGGLQVLVTNAGGPPPGPASTFDDEAWLAGFNLNFLSTVRMVRRALPEIGLFSWGRILVVTSTAAKQPIPGLAVSNSIRAATSGFAKSLSAEVASRGITVNCIMPGSILTDRLRSLTGAPEGSSGDHPALRQMAAQSPAGRLGTPEEFGAVAAFLCSERASYVNGVSLQVDGGAVKSLY
jgi:3-oxoacyl-[acyl-carrier protein] reductase